MSLDSPLDKLSPTDFDELIEAQQKRVDLADAEADEAIGKLNREKNRLRWLEQGRTLMTQEGERAANEVGKNGRPRSLIEAILTVMDSGEPMLTEEIIGELIARTWIAESDWRSASSTLSNLTKRGDLERVDRGVYRKLPASDDRSEEP
jgi:hypothetical protein